MTLSPAVETAYKAALKTRSHAYSPYSKFKVGAALKLKGEDLPVVTGCNVENASFGATVCAERAAIVRAISQYGVKPFECLVVVTGEDTATVPCALCLQVIAEFADDDLPIYLGNEKGIQSSFRLRDLLPKPFRNFKVK